LLVFLDSEELIEGNNITPQLEAAIKGASVQVAIFSPTYAKSEWCLNELVLMVNSGATLLPVFYDVEPSMVRWATGTYGEALQNLQQKRKRDPQTGELKPRYDSNTVQSWKDALLRVGGISGFVLHGDEFELLEKVVQSVVCGNLSNWVGPEIKRFGKNGGTGAAGVEARGGQDCGHCRRGWSW
jgi:hypothetical protein